MAACGNEGKLKLMLKWEWDWETSSREGAAD